MSSTNIGFVINPSPTQLLASGGGLYLAGTPGQRYTISLPAMSGASKIVLPPPSSMAGGGIDIFSKAILGFACLMTGSATGAVFGNVICASGANTYVIDVCNPAQTGANSVSFTATAQAGDRISITSDGTYYYVNGNTQNYLGVTFP